MPGNGHAHPEFHLLNIIKLIHFKAAFFDELFLHLATIFILKCNVDGRKGDGTQPGTCGLGMICNGDGTCSVCSITSSFPHAGCSTLNPICKTDLTGCVCDEVASLTCNAETDAICREFKPTAPYNGGFCDSGTSIYIAFF